MRISDWSSDVCSSDLPGAGPDPDGEEHLDTEVTVPGNRAYASLALGVDHWGWPARRRVGIADMRRRGSPDPAASGQIGRASCMKECVRTCRSRVLPFL